MTNRKQRRMMQATEQNKNVRLPDSVPFTGPVTVMFCSLEGVIIETKAGSPEWKYRKGFLKSLCKVVNTTGQFLLCICTNQESINLGECTYGEVISKAQRVVKDVTDYVTMATGKALMAMTFVGLHEGSQFRKPESADTIVEKLDGFLEGGQAFIDFETSFMVGTDTETDKVFAEKLEALFYNVDDFISTP